MSPVKDSPLGLGAPLRPFRLPEPLTGRLVGPEDFPQAQGLLVAFISNACPDVQHVAGALAALAQDLDPLGLQVLAVNSDVSDAAEEAPSAVAAEALRRGYVFPYLIDQTQAVARAYQVACTPDFYLFDRHRRLAYHGRFDETRFGGGRAAHGADLRQAALQTLKGRPAPQRQVAAAGCLLQTPGDAARFTYAAFDH
jgi:thiol-disulfide isomerase/thioredoxin